jgi:phosphatidate cytidylyltransferase
VLAAVGVGLREFYAMTLPAPEDRGARLFSLFAGMAVAGAVYLGNWVRGGAQLPVLALTFATLALFLFYLVRFGEMATVANRLAFSLAGILYVVLLLTPLAKLKLLPNGPGLIILILTISWFSDTGAYFAGRFLGRHKLYPAVSPNKTIEGAVGGLVAAFGAAALARAWYLPVLTWRDCLLIAIPAGALGQAGDLCESLLKRACGVKDSGQLLPGHGGLLDRVDAVMFATPYVYFYATYLA